MKQHFIKGFNRRYSIREDGNVIRHYLVRNGRKVYKDVVVNKYIPNKGVNYCVCLSMVGQKHGRDFLLSKLMIKYFDLMKPDDYHTYKLQFRDGDKSNYDLENIYFELDIKKDYNFQPVIFHDGRNVIEKICGCCGEKKSIEGFKLNKRGFYLHDCKTCWRKINDKTSRDKNKRIAREEIKDSYLNRLIRRTGGSPELFTEELRDIKRYTILTQREIKNKSKSNIN